MLKIKDNVDLKELEKFGFDFFYESPYIPERYCFRKEDCCNIFIPSRTIVFFSKYNGKELDIIYDLIQAGLVEKVGD